jgi:hypothetical protein
MKTLTYISIALNIICLYLLFLLGSELEKTKKTINENNKQIQQSFARHIEFQKLY